MAFAVSFSADPSLIVVDTEAGQVSGSTSITYSSGEGRVFLWFRVLRVDGSTLTGDTWERKVLGPPEVTNCPSSGCDFAGAYSVTLQPGQVWEGRLYLQVESDPNDAATKEERVATLVVAAIAMLPSQQDLLGDLDRAVGGTYFKMAVNTLEPTFCIIQVANTAPVTGPDGIERLLNTTRQQSFQLHTEFDDLVPFGFNHNFLVESHERSLLPGNDYHVLVRAFDAFGNWDTHTEPFTARLCTVTIDFDEIHIVNDGVPGDGTGHFQISVQVLPTSLPVAVCSFGPVDISDSPDPGEGEKEHIPLVASGCPPFVLPPTKITDPSFAVRVFTRGHVETTFGEADTARNLGQDFPFPEGIKEKVNHRLFATRATPEDPDDEFTFDVKTRVTVDYVEA